MNTKKLPFFKILRISINFEWIKDSQKAFEVLNRYLVELPTLISLKQGEILLVYLYLCKEATNVVSVQESQGIQKPVYYVSTAFHGVKMWYTYL